MPKSVGGADLLKSGRVCFRLSNGRKGWIEPSSPDIAIKDDGDDWDVIHIGAGAVQLHDAFIRQLRSPRRLVIPLAEEENSWFLDQYIWIVDKDESGIVTKKKHERAKYVWLSTVIGPPRDHRLYFFCCSTRFAYAAPA